MSDSLPEPRLILVYRLQATRGEPLELDGTRQGSRRTRIETAAPELRG